MQTAEPARVVNFASPEPAPPQAPASAAHDTSEAEHRALQQQIGELQHRLIEAQARLAQETAAAFEKGRSEGRVQAEARWNEAVERLNRHVLDMANSRARYRREVEDDAVRLALAIARKVLNREVTVDPEALGGIVRVAFDKLNQRELHKVRVHADDVARVRQHLDRNGCPQRVEVVAEPGLERGAVIFETERGELDASISTQLAEIDRGLTDLLRHDQK